MQEIGWHLARHLASSQIKFDSQETELAYFDALQYLSKSSDAVAVSRDLSGLTGRSEPWIVMTDAPSQFIPSRNTIYFNPNFSLDVTGQGGSPGRNGSLIQSPALVMLHEMAHAVQKNKNSDKFDEDSHTTDPQYDDKEEKRVIQGIETPAARALGEPTRQTHGGTGVQPKGGTKRPDEEELRRNP